MLSTHALCRIRFQEYVGEDIPKHLHELARHIGTMRLFDTLDWDTGLRYDRQLRQCKRKVENYNNGGNEIYRDQVYDIALNAH